MIAQGTKMAGEKNNGSRRIKSKDLRRAAAVKMNRPQEPKSCDFLSIPTEDAASALRFCQELSGFLKTNHSPAAKAISGVVDPALPLGGNGDFPPQISVVIPVYSEEENLPVLYSRLQNVLTATGLRYEIVFVDDGSRDGSLACLYRLTKEDPCVSIVELSRNFGHQVAISAGLDHTRGEGVIVMDADLQDPPEVLPEFIETWRKGHDVVYAIRKHRKEGWIKRLAYAAFYRLMHRTANIQIPLDAGDFCIMDRRVVNLLMEMPERNRFVRGIRSWVGLNQVGLEYERQSRNAGDSRYTILRLIYLALDGLISFSYLPLRVIVISGALVSFFSILMAIFYAVKRLAVGLNPPGFATLTVAMFFFAGIQLITIGVIGEYIGRIFEEVKQRPLYVVRRVTKGSKCAS